MKFNKDVGSVKIYEKGVYKGHLWFTWKNDDDLNNEFFCGYVSLCDDDISLAGKNPEFYFSELIDCHGGISFYGRISTLEEYSRVNWIGFICGHFVDKYNPKDNDYVKKECLYIIDQLISLRSEE